jgi:hypothetical protein
VRAREFEQAVEKATRSAAHPRALTTI